MESVAAFVWNGWQLCRGISGRIHLESVAALAWNTQYSEIVFYVLTVVLSYSLYHLFTNIQAGVRFADKTRQALAFEQLRTQRTHIIVYAGGVFEIFETLSFTHFILQLPAAAQDQLRHWLDAHLHTVQKRE